MSEPSSGNKPTGGRPFACGVYKGTGVWAGLLARQQLGCVQRERKDGSEERQSGDEGKPASARPDALG